MTVAAVSKPFVIVRTYSAGVHCGTLESREGRDVRLRDSRRIWRWSGANTLNELSQHGAEEAYTRISEPVPSNILTEAIEVIECSDEGRANLTFEVGQVSGSGSGSGDGSGYGDGYGDG